MPRRLVTATITLLDPQHAAYEDSYGRQVSEFRIGEDDLIKSTVARLAEWIEADERNCTREDLELLGAHLYRFVFGSSRKAREAHEDLRATYRAFKGQRAEDPDLRLRLTLAFERDALGLAHYPWEFLFMKPTESDVGFFVAGQTTQLALTRCVLPTVASAEPPKPLRIFVALCSPSGLPDLHTREVTKLVSKIRALDADERVQVLIRDENPRFSDIKEALEPPGRPPWRPDVFHFIGHGQSGQLAIRMETEEHLERISRGEDERYEATWIGQTKFAELFSHDHPPRLVFLHACESAADGNRPLGDFSKVAASLVGIDGVQAVIAMRYPIMAPDAATFAGRFYEEIVRGNPIDEAVTEARKALANPAQGEAWGKRHWGTPLLYLQTKDNAVILDAPSGPVDPTPERTRFDCPYENIKERLPDGSMEPACPGAFVVTGMQLCQTCDNPLVWCPKGHPNTVGKAECAFCRDRLPPSSAATLGTPGRVTPPPQTPVGVTPSDLGSA